MKKGTLIRSRGIKPTIIHIMSEGWGDSLCGSPKEDWADEWFQDDEFAQSLPICPLCLERRGELPTSECLPEQKPIDIPSKEMTTRERELMETRMRLREMARRLMEDER